MYIYISWSWSWSWSRFFLCQCEAAYGFPRNPGTGSPVHTSEFKCVRLVTIEILTWEAAVERPVVLSARGTDWQTLKNPPNSGANLRQSGIEIVEPRSNTRADI